MESNSDSEKEPVKPAPKVTANSAANKEERSSDDPESSQPPFFMGGGTPNSATFLSVYGLQGEKIYIFLKWPKCCLVSDNTRKKVFK